MIGSGFPIGTVLMKSVDDSNWYLMTASGSAGSVDVYVSQSALPFAAGSFFEQNFSYQIVASNDGNAYCIYLDGTPPNVSLVVSQSVYGPAFIKNDRNAVIDLSKPNLLLKNISDGNYYVGSLNTTGGTTSLTMSQAVISQSWIRE
jgi:hypothetical protein